MLRYLYFVVMILIMVMQMSCGKQNKPVEKTEVFDVGSVFYLSDTIICLDDSLCIGDFRKQFNKKKYQVVIFIDSTWCNSCRLRLYEWEKIIDDFQAVNDNLRFF